MREAWYDTAQICLNGHIITSSAKESPKQLKKFCDKCGQKTITSCTNCNTEIRGYYIIPNVFYPGGLDKAPGYCHECGQPYPWTESAFEAIKELIEISSVADAEKASVIKDLSDLAVETPRTKVAASKMRIFLKKAGKEVASGIRDIIVDIASEAAKKIILD